ncbi:imidazoleglycerol-phosphate dehydratase HisB [Candidatus Sumerlaeota bacterium]|nr:imidazoleglycerol-phosphate dehydratase HisB [Candidatus Sumerlaeota bacterium]
MAHIKRETKETQLEATLNLDGSGRFEGGIGVPFLEHMLDLFTRHGMFDLSISGQGDTQVDAHHATEDLGIVLGLAFNQAAGDKQGIARYGVSYVPMDEALARVTVDLSGRSFFVWKVNLAGHHKVGDWDVELAPEFWQGFAANAKCNFHAELLYGSNAHHKIEAVFKAAARALGMAVKIDPRIDGVLSTKGTL